MIPKTGPGPVGQKGNRETNKVEALGAMWSMLDAG